MFEEDVANFLYMHEFLLYQNSGKGSLFIFVSPFYFD